MARSLWRPYLRVIAGSLIFMAGTAGAQIQFIEDISMANGFTEWTQRMRIRHLEWRRNARVEQEDIGYAECRAIKELPRVLICGWIRQQDMNRTLLRASNFVERYRESIGSADFSDVRHLIDRMGGHNLKSEDLETFFRAVESHCDDRSGKCLNRHEKYFYEHIFKTFSSQGSFMLVTFAVQSRLSWRDAVSHELLHAQYYVHDRYREVVESYWSSHFSEEERGAVRQALSRAYDVRNEKLVINELQAYLLMESAHRYTLGPFVLKHRSRLRKALVEEGVPPLGIDTSAHIRSRVGKNFCDNLVNETRPTPKAIFPHGES